MFEAACVLDGMEYTGQMGALGNQAAHEGVFRFKDGQFYALFPVAANSDSTQQGGAYAVTPRAHECDFTAETMNALGERIHWSGTVRDNVIEGTASFFKGNRKSHDYWFSGALRPGSKSFVDLQPEAKAA